jgi:hypothetical protein
MFFNDELKCRFFKYMVDIKPARPVASMRWVNVVVPVTTPESSDLSGMVIVDEVGDPGGEGGVGGGIWDHETETGRFGSTAEKEIDVTLVCS